MFYKKPWSLFLIVFVIVLITAGFVAKKAYAASNTFYVDPDNGNDLYDGTIANYTSGTTGPVQTIGQAITLASSGDIIRLAAATYNAIGAISISKSLTIESYAGTWDSTKITKITGASDFIVAADDVTIDGITFDEVSSNSIQDSGAFDNVIIRECRFKNIDDTAVYISNGTNWLISNNFFEGIGVGGVGPMSAIIESSQTNMQITENIFLNVAGTGISDEDGTNITISDNTMYRTNLYGISLDGTTGASIRGNELENCSYGGTGAAIYLLANSLTSGSITITGNTITNTAGAGVGTAVGTSATNLGGATVMAVGNNLAGNTWGIDYAGTGTVYAFSNWWGSSTGPYHQTSNPHGLGSSITNNLGILYTPYDTVDYWVKSLAATGNISMTVFKDKLYQARRDANNHLYTRYSANGISWSAWVYGGHAYSDVAMAVNGTALYQATMGTGGYFIRRYTTSGTTWSSWSTSGSTIGKITMFSRSGVLYQTKVTSGNKAYIKRNNGSWVYVGTSLVSLETIIFGPGMIQARIASDKNIYYRSSLDGIAWSGWTKNGGTAKTINLTVFNGSGGDEIYMTKTSLTDKFYTRVTATPWGPWVQSGSAVGKSSMVVLDDRLYQSKRLSNGNIYLRYSFDGTTWSTWQLDHTGKSDQIMVPFSGELFRGYVGTDDRLYTSHM
jgi:parallel beta-helix repeat protein